MAARPHHLLWEAGRAGHVVLFCNRTQRADRAMDRVAEHIAVCHNFEALLQADLGKPVLYFNDPAHGALADRVPLEGAIFDVIDDLPDWRPGWAEACRRATEVWCASEELRRRLAAIGVQARLVPNGCDFAHFSRPAESEPLAAAVLPHPRILVAGRLGPWVDVAALTAAAAAMPDAHFLVVGPVENREYFRADGLANVHPLGERSYAQLPAYAQACDAAVIAYRAEDPTAAAADPCKLWDLLAARTPLVTSGVATACAVGDPAWCVAPGDLAPALRAALDAGRGAPRLGALQELARARTWAHSWATLDAADEAVAV